MVTVIVRALESRSLTTRSPGLSRDVRLLPRCRWFGMVSYRLQRLGSLQPQLTCSLLESRGVMHASVSSIESMQHRLMKHLVPVRNSDTCPADHAYQSVVVAQTAAGNMVIRLAAADASSCRLRPRVIRVSAGRIHFNECNATRWLYSSHFAATLSK